MARGQHLAIDVRVVPDSEKIEGMYTLETVKADGDFEKLPKSEILACHSPSFQLTSTFSGLISPCT